MWKHGVAAAVVAAIATSVLAAIASAAGVSFADSSGVSIPILGFTQLTLIFSLVGVGMAAVMARKARRPRATFVRTAIALTALSFVPDLTFGFDPASAASLITLHIVAAAIVVPTLARQARSLPLSRAAGRSGAVETTLVSTAPHPVGMTREPGSRRMLSATASPTADSSAWAHVLMTGGGAGWHASVLRKSCRAAGDGGWCCEVSLARR